MSTDGTSGSTRPRVVIVGAGFAGLNAAKALARAPVEVYLIDRNNYHKFQPLLYQVATAGLDPEEIVHPVRSIFRGKKNIHFILGTVHAIDKEARQVLTEEGPPIPYDYLMLGAGAVTNYFGVEGASKNSFPLKSVPGALQLRNHILYQFERCERDPGAAGEGALNFVIVGGGPTGVEMAGQMSELFRCVLREDFRRIDTSKARVILLEMLPEVLMPFHPSLRAYTRAMLEARRVEVRTETTVARVEPGAVLLENGERIAAQTLVWAAGVRANPLADTLGTPQASDGRLVVEADLSLPGFPEIFAVGDMCGGTRSDDNMYGQLATVAIQQGRHAARQILRRIAGRETEPFAYRDPGIMATIGRHAAVAQLPGGIRLHGMVAWLLWAFVHIAKLVGFRNRLEAFINWTYNYLTYDFGARLIMDVVPAVAESERAAAQAFRPEGPPGQDGAVERNRVGDGQEAGASRLPAAPAER